MESIATFDPDAPDGLDALDDAINALVLLGRDTADREHALRAILVGRNDVPVVSPWARAALERRLPVKEYAR